MIEVEMKFPVADPDALLHRLADMQPTAVEQREEVDQYFQAPDRDFAVTDEALRIRRVGETNSLTYKGPKLDPATKTRRELQVRLDDGKLTADLAQALLTAAGYVPVAQVVKQRQVFSLDLNGWKVEVCLDRVEDLGTFVEIEIGSEADDMEQARAELLRLAERLDLKEGERRSYLELLLQKRTGT